MAGVNSVDIETINLSDLCVELENEEVIEDFNKRKSADGELGQVKKQKVSRKWGDGEVIFLI